MNVDSQFPQPLAPVPHQRPLDKPVEQTTTRPVDDPKSAEAATGKPHQNDEKTRNEERHAHHQDAANAKRPESELSEEEKAELEKLRARDREVRAHEAAHKAAAGSHARGSAQFTFDEGPDGRRYAVGGEVSIDTSKVSGDPEATIRKAQAIQRAANAPAQPSGQDRSVASQASQMEIEARRELAESEKTASKDGPAEPASPVNRIENANAETAPVGELIDVIA